MELLILAVKSTLIVLAGLVASRAHPRASPATRHLVLSSALAAALVVPLLALLMPSVPVKLPANLEAPRPVATSATPVSMVMQLPAPEAPPETHPAHGPSAAEPHAAPFHLPRTPAFWTLVAVLAWATVALALAIRTFFGWFQLARFAARAEAVVDKRFIALVRSLLKLRRTVRLLVSDRVEMPMTWGVVRPSVLLPRAALQWPEERLRAVLLHELAHVERLDVLTQLVASLTCALYWPNPLVWIAARQMRNIRERACDDRVIQSGALPSEYARSLLDVAQHGLHARRSPFALAMACRSELEGRLLSVLDPKSPRRPLTRRAVITVASASMLLTLPVAALQRAQAETSTTASPHSPTVTNTHTHTSITDSGSTTSVSSSSSIRENGNEWTLSWSDDRGRSASVHATGQFSPNADLSDLVLKPGAKLVGEDNEGGRLRTFSLSAGPNGEQSRSYRVDGQEQPWDARWFQGFLLELDRETGFAAEARFPQLMTQGGPDAVLAEVEKMSGDYGRSVYLKRLLGSARLNDDQFVRVLRIAGRIDSDYYAGEVLGEVARQHGLSSAAAREAFFTATQKLESDYELGRALKAVLEAGKPTVEQVRLMLHAGAKMKSDYEKAQLLTALADQKLIDGEVIDDYVEAASGIQSDYEHARTMKAIDARNADPKVLRQILEQTRRIHSDYERATVLVQFAGEHALEGDLRALYERSAREIVSEYERGRALAAMR